MTELLRREELREGLIICRRRPGVLATAIMLATASKRWRIHKDAWNHDAIVVRDPADGQLKIGDALMGPGCVLTPISEWEADCIKNGSKMIVLQVVGASPAHEEEASRWWLQNVFGRKYDKVAIWRLGLKAIFGDWVSGKVGLLSHFFCTEGVRDAFANAIRIIKEAIGALLEDPWGDKDNPTPGTTWKRWKAGKLADLPGVFTDEGRKYAISI